MTVSVALLAARLASGATSTAGLPSPPAVSAGPGQVIAFTLIPQPEGGSLALQMVVRVAGKGSVETQPFDLSDRNIDFEISLPTPFSPANLGDAGRFYLVSEGRSLTDSDHPGALCCLGTSGHGDTVVSPGRYRLVVRAPSTVQWLVTVSQFHGPPLLVQTFAPSPGATGSVMVADLEGFGDERTSTLHIPAGRGYAPASAALNFGGADTKVWIVPAARQFDQKATPLNACPGQALPCSGAFGFDGSGGDYYVVVRSTSWWFLRLYVSQ